jgi:threonine aldolase
MPIDIGKMQGCDYVLTNFGPPNVSKLLHEMADSKYAQLPADVYGEGGACTEVVKRLKELFDKPAARFCVKGMVAQMALLRAVTEQAGNNRVVVHRLSHLDYDEMEAVEILHPIRFMRAGGHNKPFNVDDLDALGEKPAVVCLELPLRRAGYKLLPFAELQKISTWCHVHDVHLHIDGARIFGAAAAYGKSLSEIAALCDSLYCSFYKELKGLGGCGLVGNKAMLEATDVWVTRMGGNLPAQFPLSVSALMGLDKHLSKVKNYVLTAREIAKRFNAIAGVTTSPITPHTSGFQVHVKGDRAKIEAALLYMVESEKVWLASGVFETAIEGVYGFDVEIGGRSLELSPERWAFHMDKFARKMRT